jgi:hypothetical protein
MAPNEAPLAVPVQTPESEAAEPEAKVPAYVRRVWMALKYLSHSPKVKARAAELFAQAIDRYQSAHRAANPFNPPPLAPEAMFDVPEKIAFFCIALTPEEQQKVIDLIEALLRGTPAGGGITRFPYYVGT